MQHAKAPSVGSSERGARRGRGRSAALIASLALAMSAALLLIPAAASAVPLLGAFCEPTGVGTAPCNPEFELTEGMAIYQAGPHAGDVLVVDYEKPTETWTIRRFHEDGTPDNFSALSGNAIDGKLGEADATPQEGIHFEEAGTEQIAVDDSGGATDGNIYVTQPVNGLVDVFSSTGEFLGQLTESSEGHFEEASGVAVDASGAVYVSERFNEANGPHVHKYVPSGAIPVNGDNTLNFATPENARMLAAGAGPTAGSVFVATGGQIIKFNGSTGAEDYVVSPQRATTLALNPSSGNLFAIRGEEGGEGEVIEFDASGASSATEVSTTSLPKPGRGVAVNGATGNFYAAFGEGNEIQANVEVFGTTLPQLKLTIVKAGSGAGSVQCEVEGGGPEPCAATYEQGKTVTTIATANGGSEFGGWSGDCDSVSGNECEVEMDAGKTIEATFVLAGEHTLSITKAGTGTGTVECEVNGGAAGPCASSYPNGTSVKLKATPSASSEFVGYSGDCSGASCELTISANKAVTATFNLIPRTLTIVKAGTGTGEVKCKVNGGPEEACASSYPNGTALQLVAEASPGSEFAGFSAGSGSAASCSTSPCSFTIEANSTVTATFDLIPRTLTIAKAGTGTGEVKCKVNGGPEEACAASYPSGTALQLLATANAGSESKGFSTGSGSAASCSTSPCSFTIEANSTVTATFDLIPRTLTIVKAGTGTGTVECEVKGGPAEPCAPTYPNGSSVKLKAVPAAGSEFVGYSGVCSGATCTLTMSGNRSVTATFNLIPRTLTVAKAGSGSGSVSCNGGACAPTYPNGTQITLSASPASGSSFTGFSGGGCSGTSCTLKIEADTTVTATFDAIPAPPAPLPPAPTPQPAPKPLKCKKGFTKKKVHGKARCVKVKKHHKHSKGR